jgi:GH15 family glucan-1,4-alpha-glucosidase
MTKQASDLQYPLISDYGLISDCHCTALVSRSGSIDWCCMPRMDSDSCFGRILDWNIGGHCSITPTGEFESTRQYEGHTLVLMTRFRTSMGEVVLRDFYTISDHPEEPSHYRLVRIVEGVSGDVELKVEVCPRFDFGEIAPYVRKHQDCAFTAWGSNQGMIIHCDRPLELEEHRNLQGTFTVRKGERLHLAMRFEYPEHINENVSNKLDYPEDLDGQLQHCLTWWNDWSKQVKEPYNQDAQTMRSALMIKGLTFERTGAIMAAATTSLPEWIGGERNWDYRYSWVRDSMFAVSALNKIGITREARRFGDFIERSSAGNADELQVMFGIDGKRRLSEIELPWLSGYRDSKPVRVGNEAFEQIQLDVYSQLMELAWIRYDHGEKIDHEFWDFLVDVANTACKNWMEPDYGIWEVRGGKRHFVNSKAMCWAAIKRGVDLAKAMGFKAPVEHWSKVMQDIKNEVNAQGFDKKRNTYLQCFEDDYLDASVLLLPRFHFVEYDDPKMIGTADALCKELDCGGLLLRYNSPDGLEGKEGAFLTCTFWLVSCLAQQGRLELAQQYYERTLACVNDIGLFSEEYAVEQKLQLGNFPQILTHLSQITARLSLHRAYEDVKGAEGETSKKDRTDSRRKETAET